MASSRRARGVARGRTTARPSGFATAISPQTRHPAHPNSRRSDRPLAPRPRRLVSDYATASFRQSPWPRPGQHPGLIRVAVALPSSPSPSINLIVALPLRPFTAALPPSRRARRASLGQHGGPIGLVCDHAAASRGGARVLVPGSPEASSRQSSSGRGGDYKGSPTSPPRRCRADRRAGTASLVSWAAVAIIARTRSAGKLLYLPIKRMEAASKANFLTQPLASH